MPWKLLGIAVIFSLAACGGDSAGNDHPPADAGDSADGSGVDAGAGDLLSGDGGGPPDTGGDALPSGNRPECTPCDVTAQCASGLECGRPPGAAPAAFCVDPFETTECCVGAGSAAVCAVVEGSMLAAKQCPAQKPATSDPCVRQSRCLYGQAPFLTPCECLNGAWLCHDCPTSSPTGVCPGGSAGQLCPYGDVQCSCQVPVSSSSGTWHCNGCPAEPPSGTCGANDYCGYLPNTSCVCSAAGAWGCFGLS